MDQPEAAVLFALAALMTLMVWNPDPLWNWTCQCGLFLLAAILSFHEWNPNIQYKLMIPLGVIGGFGFVQLALGWTVYRYATLEAALRCASCVATAFASASLLARSKTREAVLHWLCWFAVGIALVSVLAYHTSPGKIFWLFDAIYPDNWGPFPSRNNFAQFLELAFPVAAYELYRRQKMESQKEAIWLAGLAPALLFASGIASASRAGAAILLLEALCLLVLLRKRARNLLAGLALATVALVLVMGPGTLISRLREPDPLAVRREIFTSAWQMAANRPWTGYGLGTFSHVYPEFASFDPGTNVEHAHNDWLEWASEGGAPFAFLWLLMAIFIAPRAVRSIWGVGILGVLLHAVVDYPFARLGVSVWWFALFGALLSFQPHKAH